jgi:hypothetical protein
VNRVGWNCGLGGRRGIDQRRLDIGPVHLGCRRDGKVCAALGTWPVLGRPTEDDLVDERTSGGILRRDLCGDRGVEQRNPGCGIRSRHVESDLTRRAGRVLPSGRRVMAHRCDRTE